MEGLKAINARRRVFADLRGEGVWIGCELDDAWKGKAMDVVQRRRRRRARCVLVAGPDVVRIAPSLVISLDEILEGLARLETALNRALVVDRRAAGTMFFVRPIARDDLPAVLALSERTGTGLTTLPANRERLPQRIERSLASFAGTADRADACYMFVLVDGSRRRARRRHQRDRGGGRPAGALVQLSRRHARARVARARRLHGRADAVPRQRPHRPHRALLAVPRPGATGTARTARCSRRAACCSSPSSPSASRRRSSPSCAAGSTPDGRARSGKGSAAISSRWNTRRPTT